MSTKEGEQFAEDNGLMFLETSARTGNNVEAAFTKTAEKIYDNILRGIYDPNNDVRTTWGWAGCFCGWWWGERLVEVRASTGRRSEPHMKMLGSPSRSSHFQGKNWGVLIHH